MHHRRPCHEDQAEGDIQVAKVVGQFRRPSATRASNSRMRSSISPSSSAGALAASCNDPITLSLLKPIRRTLGIVSSMIEYASSPIGGPDGFLAAGPANTKLKNSFAPSSLGKTYVASWIFAPSALNITLYPPSEPGTDCGSTPRPSVSSKPGGGDRSSRPNRSSPPADPPLLDSPPHPASMTPPSVQPVIKDRTMLALSVTPLTIRP